MTRSLLAGGAFTRPALDTPARPAVLRLLRDRIARVRTARHALGRSQAPLRVHAFRVALRQLRAVLRVYGSLVDDVVPRRVRARLRATARATSRVRDLDVKRAWLAEQREAMGPEGRPGLRWLDARLRTARHAALRRARRSLGRAFSSLLDDLEQRLAAAPARDTPTLAAATGGIVRTLTADLDRRLAAVRSVRSQAQAHDARLAGKRVRYALEPLATVLPSAQDLRDTLKALQDLLGEMHDADVALGVIAAATRYRRSLPGLRALAGLAASRRRAAWQALERDWLLARDTRLRQPLAALATLLESGAAAIPVEVERKFLLRGVPPRAKRAEPVRVDQGYLPGTVIHERLRRVRGPGGTSWARTVKLGEGVARQEYEEPTTNSVFRALWPLTAGRRVRKRRYRVRSGGLVWEVDEFLDRRLVLAEVELRSATKPPPLPAWLAPWVVREVTAEPEYLNVSLAR